MLILTRKLGESIAIGDQIKVTLIEIQGKQVKIGVIAPKDVSIHRQEIYERIFDKYNAPIDLLEIGVATGGLTK